VTEKLQELLRSAKTHDRFLHEFFVPVRDIASNPNYDDFEKSFCEKLKAGPMTLEEAARSMGKDVYTFHVPRLEREGVVMRAGLTPTDIMHLKGDFDRYDSSASALGARYIAECIGTTPEKLYDKVYGEVKLKLYANITRVLLQNKYPHLEKTGLGPDIEMMITESFRKKDRGMIDFMFKTPFTLVGIGAPIHIFLPDVARALHTEYIVPEYAPVANALGAVVGNVSAVCTVEVKPKMQSDMKFLYIVYGREKNTSFTSKAAAEREAAREAQSQATEEAQKRGAGDDISVSSQVTRDNAMTAEGKMYLGSRAVATAVGRISFE
jgi:N-methylhydantoinase A/oxoprolinase/acetone carboxylase beta subunit